MKKLIVLSFKQMNDADLAKFTTDVRTKMKADAQFAVLKPFVSDLDVCADAFDVAGTNATNGGSMFIKEKNRKFDGLTDQLTKTAVQVEIIADGDEDVALAAGFEVVKPAKPITELATPANLSVINVDRSGSVKLTWASVAGALTYAVERKESADGVWLNGDYSSAKSLILSNLKPGTNITFRVRALGRKGLVSEFSQEVSLWVA